MGNVKNGNVDGLIGLCANRKNNLLFWKIIVIT